MISVLSLVVTILVAFISPYVALKIARAQIAAASNEAWRRERKQITVAPPLNLCWPAAGPMNTCATHIVVGTNALPRDHPTCRSDNFIRKKCALARSFGPGTSLGGKEGRQKTCRPELSCAQCPPRATAETLNFSRLRSPLATSGFAGRLSTP